MSNPPSRKFDNCFARLERWRAAGHALLPQACALCAAECATDIVCAACDRAMPRLPPACPTCALPTPGGVRCGRCVAHPPPFAAALAAFTYAYPVDRLLHALKYGGALAHADYFADALAPRIVALPDLVVALPLAPARQRERGFNQAREIARRLAARVGVPLADGLVRARDTAAQTALPWSDRRRNVRGAFAALPALARRRIAIVDDVMTTGATLEAAATAALRGGAVAVDVWVAARTL